MTWTWLTSGPEGQAWMLRHIEQAGLEWTPPPEFPQKRKGPAPLTLRQRIGSVWGPWPVRAPDGRPPLPAEARVLKAINTRTVCDLFEEAGRLRLGFGSGGPWLPAHLDPDAVHYLVPDPADFSWPGRPAASGGTIQWWECTVVLRMADGEQVKSGVSVLPETFTALPSTLPRHHQRRLLYAARTLERDTGLWGRDHKAECSPQVCGYDIAEEQLTPDHRP